MKLTTSIRIWLDNRKARQLLYKASCYLVQKDTRPDYQVPDYTRRPWFAILVLATAFGCGYITADDQRIEAAAACVRPCHSSLPSLSIKEPSCKL